MELFIGLGLILFAVIGFNMNKASEERNNRIQNQKRQQQQRQEKYELKKAESNVPSDSSIVTCINNFKLADKLYIWVKENTLLFFPAYSWVNEEYHILYKIPINNIEYFATQGQVTSETVVSGGGGTGGGISLAGAVIGGVIAGPAGAIIGSRKKTQIEPIKSETRTNDNRETVMNFYKNDIRKTLVFAHDDFSTLLKLIPNKTYENFIKTNGSIQNNEESLVEQIKGLADLKDKGIITEEEFSLKKKQLLGI